MCLKPINPPLILLLTLFFCVHAAVSNQSQLPCKEFRLGIHLALPTRLRSLHSLRGYVPDLVYTATWST